jgi:hypothetical protein
MVGTGRKAERMEWQLPRTQDPEHSGAVQLQRMKKGLGILTSMTGVIGVFFIPDFLYKPITVALT